MKQRITNVPRQFVEHSELVDLFFLRKRERERETGRSRSKMRLQRILRPLAALLTLALSLTLTSAAIDKDNKSSLAGINLPPSPSVLNGAELQHNVINLSLHTEIKGSSSGNNNDSFVKFDLTRTQRLRDSLNVFDLSLLAEQWPRLEAERVLSVNCTKDMRSYLRGLSEASMWAVKSKYSQKKKWECNGK